MSACQLKETPIYGYDKTHPVVSGTGMPIFGYDFSANCFLATKVEYVPGSAARFHQFTGKERDSESGLDYFG